MLVLDLSYDVFLHIFQYVSLEDCINLSSLNNCKLNEALETYIPIPKSIYFYKQILQYFPLGEWYIPNKLQFLCISLLPNLTLEIVEYRLYSINCDTYMHNDICNTYMYDEIGNEDFFDTWKDIFKYRINLKGKTAYVNKLTGFVLEETNKFCFLNNLPLVKEREFNHKREYKIGSNFVLVDDYKMLIYEKRELSYSCRNIRKEPPSNIFIISLSNSRPNGVVVASRPRVPY